MQELYQKSGIIGGRSLPPPALYVTTSESMGKLNLALSIATMYDKPMRYTPE
jgi:hypothetical protein